MKSNLAVALIGAAIWGGIGGFLLLMCLIPPFALFFFLWLIATPVILVMMGVGLVLQSLLASHRQAQREGR